MVGHIEKKKCCLKIKSDDSYKRNSPHSATDLAAEVIAVGTGPLSLH